MTTIRIGAGESAVLFAAAVYGVSTTVSVVALDAVRPADLLAVELVGAAAMLLGAAALRRRLRSRGAIRHLLLGSLFPGATFLLADLGLARTSAANGSLLLAVDPLLSVLLAVVVLRERLRGGAVVALAIGLTGGALVAVDASAAGSGGDMTAGNLLVLAAVVAGAVFLVAARRYSGDGDGDGLNVSAWQTTGGALSTAPFVAFSWAGGGSRLDTAGVAAWTACIGVVLCGAVASVAFNRGIARVPASRAGQLMNLTPAVGTLTAVVFLGDRPTALQLLGGAAILIGLALLLRNAPVPDPDDDNIPAVPASTALPAGPSGCRTGEHA